MMSNACLPWPRVLRLHHLLWPQPPPWLHPLRRGCTRCRWRCSEPNPSLQFLKLGAAQAIPSLSDHFVVWDLDMILLRPLEVLHATKTSSTAAVVNVGGARRIPGYKLAYQKLTGRRCVL